MVAGAVSDSHPVHGEADIASDVLSLVDGGHLEVGSLVHRDVRRVALAVELEQVELAVGPDTEVCTALMKFFFIGFEQEADIALERSAVRVADVAEEPGDLFLRGSPGEDRHGVGVREQQEVGVLDVEESPDRCGIETDAVLQCMLQRSDADGDVLQLSENVAECQSHEDDVLLLHVLHDAVLKCAFHIEPLFLGMIVDCFYEIK